MRPWLRIGGLTTVILAVGSSIIGCQPADQSVRTVKELLNAGEIVEFTEPDYRRPSCPDTRADWTDLLVDEDTRRQIVAGHQQSVLSPGRHSCTRIGSLVDLKSPNIKTNGGRVEITKIALVRLEKLEKRHLKGRYYASDDSFQKVKAIVGARLQPFHDGIVMITSFRYISGSAQDEESVRQRDLEERSGDGLVETVRDGDTLTPKCKALWNKVIMPLEFQSAVQSQELRSWYNMGDYNCLPQGSIAGVSNSRDGAASLQVRITKVRKFRVAQLNSKLNSKYFSMSEQQWALVYPRIQQDLMRRQDEWISVTDFSIVETPVQQPGSQSGGEQ